jgi:hypothetical protein
MDYLSITNLMINSWRPFCKRELDKDQIDFLIAMYDARLSKLEDGHFNAILDQFLLGHSRKALAMLNIAHIPDTPAPACPSNGLVIVEGSPTYMKGMDNRGWQNAVDGDFLQGWDGTTWARGTEGGPAWAILEFANHENLSFDHVAVILDNGHEDDAMPYPYQTRTFSIQTSATGCDHGDFMPVATFKVSKSGKKLWFKLQEPVSARYIKLLLQEPSYYPGQWRQIVEFEVHTTSKQGAQSMNQNLDVAELPQKFELMPNHPNPFNSATTFVFSVPHDVEARMVLYDIRGRELDEIYSGLATAGTHRVEYSFHHLPSGVYFYQLNAGSFNTVRKLSLIK